MTVHDLITRLPEPEELLLRCRAFAVVDAVYDVRFAKHGFVAEWAPGAALATMDNGGGDSFHIVFEPAGVFLVGFDHESEASPYAGDGFELWPGLLDGLPTPFVRWTEMAEFQFDDILSATVCAWREAADTAWRCGPVEFDRNGADGDGADYLFGLVVDGSVDAYVEYAKGYFERAVDRDAVAAVFAGGPLTEGIVRTLNPAASFTEVAAVARTAGFPVEG